LGVKKRMCIRCSVDGDGESGSAAKRDLGIPNADWQQSPRIKAREATSTNEHGRPVGDGRVPACAASVNVSLPRPRLTLIASCELL
jgi:hypothetical protein